MSFVTAGPRAPRRTTYALFFSVLALVLASTFAAHPASAQSLTMDVAGTSGDNGWYVSPVDMALVPTGVSANAVASASYSVDGGPMQPYTGDIAIAQDGIHSVYYVATDLFGNVTSNTMHVKIDHTPPGLTAKPDKSSVKPSGKNRSLVITVTGITFDNLSGVNPNSLSFTNIDEWGLVQPQSGTFTLQSDGSYTFTTAVEATKDPHDQDGRQYYITVYAKDMAGNTGTYMTTVTVPTH